jgi:hypothetical protein
LASGFENIFDDNVITKIQNKNLSRDELDRHLTEIAHYIRQQKYPGIVNESVRCLHKLYTDPKCPAKELSKFGKIIGRFHINKETISKIKKLETTEIEFKILALNMKRKFRDERILLKKPCTLTALIFLMCRMS